MNQCIECNTIYPIYKPRIVVIPNKMYECFICKTLKCGYCNNGWIPYCSRRALQLYFCSKECDDKYEEID